MPSEFTDAELEAYLDESLDATKSLEIEQQLRLDAALLKRLSHINGRRDAGMHTLGEIWRRNQIGVPPIERMQEYLNGTLPTDDADYIDFRIRELKCPFTIAMKKDLQAQQAGETGSSRREKFYEKSAGLLRKKKR